MNRETLDQARRNLVMVGLIAYQKPLYQVLALDGRFEPAPVADSSGRSLPEPGTYAITSAYGPAEKPSYRTDNNPSTGIAANPSSGRGGMQSVKEILKTIMEDPQ
jgi:hypothetical protein